MFKFFERFKPREGQELPDYWQNYADSFSAGIAADSLLRTVRFVVVDTETTGLNPKTDRLLSVGAIGVQNWQINIADRFEVLLRQTQLPGKSDIEIHGILPVDKAGMLEESHAVESLLTFLGNAVLVGHHLGFDMEMLNRALGRMNLPNLKNRVIDTHRLAIRVDPPSGGIAQPGLYTLDSLCAKYHIPAADRHTAAGDAFLTAILFLKLAARLEKRGVNTLAQLLK